MKVKISSVGEMVSLLHDRVSEENRILWYRGHRDASWTLTPTVKRGYTEDERNLTHRFRSRAGIRHGQIPAYGDLASWLALMQHYGLPTKLLDWSRSPMVALFFALENAWRYKDHIDACIWILEPHGLNSAQGLEPVTAALNAEMYAKFIAPAYYHQSEEPGTVAAAMASETDQRMFVQQGCFTIHSADTPLSEMQMPDSVLTKMIIPAQHIRELSYDIELCGFRRGDLFPDLQNLADELRVTYYQKGA